MSESPATIVDPRPAVAGVVRSPDGRILLCRRNPRLKFMGGRYAFPGGAVDVDDRAAQSPGDDEVASVDAMALARELFEETGLLITQGSLPPGDDLRAARRAMLEGQLQFGTLLSRHGLRVDARRFRPAGVFVTPETSPRRFHARYYLIDQVAIGDEELIPGELVSLEWMTPGEARRRWRQKEIELAPPVAFVLGTLATSSLDTALARLAAAEPFTTGPASCHEIRPGIRVMPLRAPALPPAKYTNCLIIGDSQLFLIDPAATDEDEQERLTRQLDHWMHEGAKPAAVLLTHAHIDHVGSAALLRERYGVPLWAHEATIGRVEFPIDRTLADEEMISIPGDPGWQLRCLYTPGHDPGHLCFLEETSATLISGDMVAGQSSIVIPHGHGGDMSAYLDSMQRLLRVDCDLLIPSHGFAVANPSKVVQAQIDHRLARERKIKAALDRGTKGINELLEVCYDDAPSELRKFAEHTLKAHLVRLGVTEFDD